MAFSNYPSLVFLVVVGDVFGRRGVGGDVGPEEDSLLPLPPSRIEANAAYGSGSSV